MTSEREQLNNIIVGIKIEPICETFYDKKFYLYFTMSHMFEL